jgi:hypothetical protein
MKLNCFGRLADLELEEGMIQEKIQRTQRPRTPTYIAAPVSQLL